MTEEQARFARLMDLFNDALERDEAEREAFLDRQCNGDMALRTELKALLARAATTAPPSPRPAWPAWEDILSQMNSPSASDLTGRQLGHYEIRARLGAGGMGEVWRAWDVVLKREVAIKMLPAELASDPAYLNRFQQEARAASALQHANIITIYEVGQATNEHGALPFIVTELIEGQTLRAYLTQPATNRGWRDAVRLATQIASALTAAHAAYLIHRDIKPENIMVTAQGQVKVLDFGIAKLAGSQKSERGTRKDETEQMPKAERGARKDEETQAQMNALPTIPTSDFRLPTSNLTAPGTRLGTIRYMSPEQARGGEALAVRTDIFSFGLVLYELLTGQQPYGDLPDDEMLRQLTSDEEIHAVSKMLPNLPAALDRIVTRALKKKREERYATANEMLGDLQQLRINREEMGLQRLRTSSAN